MIEKNGLLDAENKNFAENAKELTDNELVFIIREKDPERYAEIIDRYQGKLFTYIYRLVGSREEAEDILQDVFIKAFRNLNSYDSDRKFSSWIYRIAHNETVNHIKRKSLRRLISWENVTSIKDILATINVKDDLNEELIRKETNQEVNAAVEKLAFKYKQVITLRYFLEKSYEEIGEILGKPVNTVGTLINRAKKNLVLELKKLRNKKTKGERIKIMELNKMEKHCANVKGRVMKEIKNKKIKMRSSLIFLAEKIGLAGAAALAVFSGALLFSLIFYFIKKTGLFLFLTLGAPGMKVFFSSLPYGHILLFIAAIILAIYLANQWELFSGCCEHTNRFAVFFLLAALVLGSFSTILGAENFFKNHTEKKIPSQAAASGKIKYFLENKIIIEDEDGKPVSIFVENVPDKINYEKGKFLRAVGQIEKTDDSIFRAVRIRCCDDE